MKIALIGLGRMGSGLAKNIVKNGHEVVAWNRTPPAPEKVQELGCAIAPSVEELVQQAGEPGTRIVWSMLPAGQATEEMVGKLLGLLSQGDVLIEGGNAFYKDSLRRAKEASDKGIIYMDMGVSGGVDGAENGACVMIGGDKATYDMLVPMLDAISVEGGHAFIGPSGCGHFAKMVHNGIEYGMMGAIAEGAEVLAESPLKPDLKEAMRVYRHGSVIRSWLVDLTSEALNEEATLSGYNPVVGASGEGEWTILTAKELNVPVPVIEASLDERKKSKEKATLTGRALSAMRWGFGHHPDSKLK